MQGYETSRNAFDQLLQLAAHYVSTKNNLMKSRLPDNRPVVRPIRPKKDRLASLPKIDQLIDVNGHLVQSGLDQTSVIVRGLKQPRHDVWLVCADRC